MLSGVPHFLTVLAGNIFLVLAMVVMATNSFARKEKKKDKTVYFGIGPEFAVPVGYLSRISTFGIGASALLEVKTSQAAGITLALSYTRYIAKGSRGFVEQAEQLAGLLGARYYFDKHFFASGQIGYNIHEVSGEFEGSVEIAPGVGFKYGLLDATLKYRTANRSKDNHLSGINLRLAVAL